MTDCAEMRPTISAHHDGELEPAQRELVAAHLADCPVCSTYLRDLGQIYAAQENLAEAERTLGQSLAILERKLGATDLELLETRTSYETVRRALESSPASGL